MADALKSASLWDGLRHRWSRSRLRDQRFAFMWDAAPDNEWVSLDCETTGLNRRSDDIISIGAVRIVGNRVMTSERLELLVRPEQRVSAESVRVHRLREKDVAAGIPQAEAMERLMNFIGSRPLVGYYLEFDVAMINRALSALTGVGLPQRKIEVSGLYYDYKAGQMKSQQYMPDVRIDLSFATLMADLALPTREAHDALNDAVMAALAFVKLRALLGAAG